MKEIKEKLKNALQKKLLFLDTETSWIVKKRNWEVIDETWEIIQLAMKWIWEWMNNEYIKKFKPTVKIQPAAIASHWIFDKDLESLSEMSYQDKKIIEKALEQSILVAHNAKFDIKALKKHWIEFNDIVKIDTLILTQYLQDQLEDCDFYDNAQLQYLRYALLEHDFFDKNWVEIRAHDAFSDVLVLEEVFVVLVKKYFDFHWLSFYSKEDINKWIKDLILLSNNWFVLKTWTFWKHEWKLSKEIPKSYFERMIKEEETWDWDWFWINEVKTAKHFLWIK